MLMTDTAVEEFVKRWAVADLREQQAAQSHFNELCHLLGVQTPTQADPKGEFFAFEKNTTEEVLRRLLAENLRRSAPATPD